MPEPSLVYVDDEPHLCRLFTALLGELGSWRIETFTQASAALAHLQAHPADLLICDYRMPEMTGLQLLDQLPDPPPCVMVTGDHGLEKPDARVRAVVPKPFSYPELAKLIQGILTGPA